MDSTHTVEWLDGLGLGEYAGLFIQEGFTHVYQLQEMTADQMKALGITKLGHIKRIMKNIPGGVGSPGTPDTPRKSSTADSPNEQVVQTSANPSEGVSSVVPATDMNGQQSADKHGGGVAEGLLDGHSSQDTGLQPPGKNGVRHGLGGTEQNPEFSAPPVPLRKSRRRHSSDSPSGAMSPEHSLAPRGVERPPTIPARQQSLKRNSRSSSSISPTGERVSRRRSTDHTRRLSLPPDAFVPKEYMGNSDLRSHGPVVSACHLSLSPSPPLVESLTEESVETVSAENQKRHSTDLSSSCSSSGPSSVLDGLSNYTTESDLVASDPAYVNVNPVSTSEQPPGTYINVPLLKQGEAPKPIPRRAASMKQPVPAPRAAPRKKFGSSFKEPPNSSTSKSAEQQPSNLLATPEASRNRMTLGVDECQQSNGKGGPTSEQTEGGGFAVPVSQDAVEQYVDTTYTVNLSESTEKTEDNCDDDLPLYSEISSPPSGPSPPPIPLPYTESSTSTAAPNSSPPVQAVMYTEVLRKKGAASDEKNCEANRISRHDSEGSEMYATIPPLLDSSALNQQVSSSSVDESPGDVPEVVVNPGTVPSSEVQPVNNSDAETEASITTPSSEFSPEQSQQPSQLPHPAPTSPDPPTSTYEFVDLIDQDPGPSQPTQGSDSVDRPSLQSYVSSPEMLHLPADQQSSPPPFQRTNNYIECDLPGNGTSGLVRSVSTGVARHHLLSQSSRTSLTNTLPASGTRIDSLSPGSRKRLGTLSEMGDSLLISPAWARINVDSQAPKTKEGWLEKRGGKKGDKPWQQRWFTFDESSLRYFKTRNDKESEFLKEVRVSEINDVKQAVDKENRKLHRLDLMTSNRVFQLAAPSEEECLQWIAVLQGAIASFRPSEALEGGYFHNPDKSGWMQKQGHGTIKRWEKRFVALKGSKFAYYSTKEDFLAAKPIHVLESKLLNIRPDMSSSSYRFTITSANKSYQFQASTDIERMEWIDALRVSVLRGLNEEKGAPATRAPSSQDILERIYANSSNMTCADCSSSNPVWASVNLCVMLCINCSGVHRALGVHISKVRSAELDKSIWTDTLVNLMVAIGNSAANRFWEHHLQRDKLDAEVERDIREAFIRAKYETKAWIPRVGQDQETLSRALCVSVTTANVQRSYELICGGADVKYEHPSPKCAGQNSPMLIAKANDEILQAELLKQYIHEAESSGVPSDIESVQRKGFLSKTGGDRTGWRKRYCFLNADGFHYYKDDSCGEMLGSISIGDMLSVSIIDDDSLTPGSAKYFQFEVTTVSRGYLLGADLEIDRTGWVKDFETVIPRDAADSLGFDKVGYMQLSYKLPPVWRHHWFTLKGKELAFYKRGEEKETLDLRKMTDVKPPDRSSTEAMCTLGLTFPQKSHVLRTNTPLEAQVWYEALRHTQVSGIPLKDQLLTNYGVPIIIHKCIEFIETHGMEVEGIYRHSGQKAKIQRLMLEFNQDAKGVVINSDLYNVHDVTGCMKQFFRCLPDPLLTHHLYQSLIATSQMSDHEAQLYQLQSLLDQLPQVNMATLKRVIGHLSRVTDGREKNKMGLDNIVKIFGPTLMTVDGDTISFTNSSHEFKVITILISFYKWLFQVDDEELQKEKKMQDAMKRLVQAKEDQQESINSFTATFIVTVFVQHKDGDSCNIKVSQLSAVSEVTEKVATIKALPMDSYALYLVMGDAVSERFIHPSERVLGVIQHIASDHYLCIKPNTMATVLRGHLQPNKEPVGLYVRDKKKWNKKLHAAAILARDFVLYKDPKLYKSEVYRASVDDFDLYIGFAPDVKHPAPTRYQFCLRAGTEEKTRYICADTEQDLFVIIGAITHAKFPEGISTPEVPRPGATLESPQSPCDVKSLGVAQAMSEYTNVKIKPKPGR